MPTSFTGVLSILIIIVLNSWSDNSKSLLWVWLWCLLCLSKPCLLSFIMPCNFLLIIRNDMLGERDSYKQPFSNVVGGREASLVLWFGLSLQWAWPSNCKLHTTSAVPSASRRAVSPSCLTGWPNPVGQPCPCSVGSGFSVHIQVWWAEISITSSHPAPRRIFQANLPRVPCIWVTEQLYGFIWLSTLGTYSSSQNIKDRSGEWIRDQTPWASS